MDEWSQVSVIGRMQHQLTGFFNQGCVMQLGRVFADRSLRSQARRGNTNERNQEHSGHLGKRQEGENTTSAYRGKPACVATTQPEDPRIAPGAAAAAVEELLQSPNWRTPADGEKSPYKLSDEFKSVKELLV